MRLTNARQALSENRQTHTYCTLTHIYRSKQTVRDITNEILAVKDRGIALFWNFVVTVAFYNSLFIFLLGSANRMNAFDLFGMIDMVATVFKEIANLSSSKLLLEIFACTVVVLPL